MIWEGNLVKMRTELAEEVQYYLPDGQNWLSMNSLIGSRITVTWLNQIHCIRCGKPTKTSFAQGYCYPCFISAPETEDCVLRPELCKAHEGIARDIEYAKEHCLIDHVVYLADSGGIKVGVTRHTQVPARWIDQGASAAIKLARTPNRFTAGLIEVALKNNFPDKTNWRLMLRQTGQNADELYDKKGLAEEMLPFDLRNYMDTDDTIIQIRYPVQAYPESVKALSLEKTREITGVLTGIIGQYLVFAGGAVINIRKHGGYLVSISSN
ncbi:MAG TPA: DUF2797 domain-containing protein [Bacteroidales bacterium]|nr:DUF2797 domain-containing protein [Bacteroidales bacterium]